MALPHHVVTPSVTPRGGAGPRVLFVDNVDSFTYNLVHALAAVGLTCEVVRHDVDLADVVDRSWAGLVIGPGPCSPAEAGLTVPLLKRLDEGLDGRPVLGICLGLQAMAVATGGTLRRARRPVHGEVVSLRHDGRGCLAALSAHPRVVRYNSLVVDELPERLEACAWDEQGDVMALRDRQRPWEGVQFHPEAWRSTEGLPVLRQWAREVAACERGRPRAGYRA